MAHHQGMSLLSLAHLLLDRPMQRRFVSDPLFQATLLLLQERIPRANALYSNDPERVDSRARRRDCPRCRCASSTRPTRGFPACSCCPTAATT